MTVLTLEEAVGRVEGLTLSDQQLLRSILSDLLYKKKPVRELKAGEDPGALLDAGLAVQVDDPPGFAADPALGKVGRKLCTYLTRRNESEAYYDPDLDRFVDIPKGSRFSAVVSISGGSSLSLSFPDDEITELLDLHGVNRCRTWKLPPKEGGV